MPEWNNEMTSTELSMDELQVYIDEAEGVTHTPAISITITPEHNAKGRPKYAESCPVALALREQYPGATRVYTTSLYSYVYFADTETVRLMHTPELGVSIECYDWGILLAIPEGTYEFIPITEDDGIVGIIEIDDV